LSRSCAPPVTGDPRHVDVASVGITIARINVHSLRLSEAVDLSAIHDRVETARLGSGQMDLAEALGNSRFHWKSFATLEFTSLQPHVAVAQLELSLMATGGSWYAYDVQLEVIRWQTVENAFIESFKSRVTNVSTRTSSRQPRKPNAVSTSDHCF